MQLICMMHGLLSHPSRTLLKQLHSTACIAQGPSYLAWKTLFKAMEVCSGINNKTFVKQHMLAQMLGVYVLSPVSPSQPLLHIMIETCQEAISNEAEQMG